MRATRPAAPRPARPGTRRTKLVPPAERLDRDLAAVRLDEARARSRARGRIRGGRGRRRRRRGRTARRRARAARSGMPGPRSTIRTIDPVVQRPRAHEHRMPARVPDAFSSRFANARSSWAASARISGSSGRDLEAAARRRTSSAAAEMTSPTSHQSRRGSAAFASSRLRSSRLSISRERRSASSLHDRGQLAAARRRRRPRAAERLGGREDRGERRAQVVRDGPQQRGLDDVAAPQRRGLHAARRAARRARSRRPAGPRARARPGPASRASVGSRQVGRHEQRAEPAGRPRSSGNASTLSIPRCDARRARSTRTAGRASRPGRAETSAERAIQVVRAQQPPGHVGREVGLAPALIRLVGTAARPLRELARDDRRDEEDRQRDPVLGLRDVQAGRSAGCGRS